MEKIRVHDADGLPSYLQVVVIDQKAYLAITPDGRTVMRLNRRDLIHLSETLKDFAARVEA